MLNVIIINICYDTAYFLNVIINVLIYTSQMQLVNILLYNKVVSREKTFVLV